MPPPVPSSRPAATRAALVLFLVCLAYNLCLGAVGWNNTICDFFANRQTQTALSTYTQLGHHYALDYETPVLGPPWSMPFEFPLYNWLVAAVTTVSGWPLDQCGRLVSRAFFLLALLPYWSILGQLGFTPARRLVGLALLLVSPFYIFWSRTFLMETTALCLSLAYFACAWAAMRQPRPGVAAAALALGILASLVKITTFAGFFLMLGLAALPLLRRGVSRRQVALLVVLLVLPTASGVLWAHFADALKSENQFARFLTTASLRTWNFGTLDQRLRPRTWQRIFAETHLALGYAGTGAVLPVAAVLLARRRRRQVAACLLVYLTLPLVFTNLYYQHQYYPCATNVYLIAAGALGLVALAECGDWRRWLAAVGLAAVLVLAPLTYARDLYSIQATDCTEVLAACRAARDATAPDELLIGVGSDWSAEIPYYSERRAIMIPVWGWFPLSDLPRYLKPAKGCRVGALVVRYPSYFVREENQALDALHALGFTPRRVYADAEFEVYRLVPAGSPP
jgi:hypothetical protein